MSVQTADTTQRERELAAIIGAYNDVTERLKESHEKLNSEVEKLRRELQDKNRELARTERLAALGQMATGVAHEIRNPLGSIQLYASLLERDLCALPEAQRLVRKIAAGVTALDRIVGDILDFAGRQQINPVQISLQTLIANVFDVAAAAAHSKRVNLLIDTTVLNLQVCVDQMQIERAMLNVVLNGIDAVDSGGTVSVTAAADVDDMVTVQFLDDGPGIADSVIDRIFNPFFTTKDTGTGLGLAIVHRIIESHGGTLLVKNRESGGACFSFRLPCVFDAGNTVIS